MKQSEFNDLVQSEYSISPKEYVDPGKEYFTSWDNEYFAVQEEILSNNHEYFYEESASEKKRVKKEKRDHKKLIHKMGYMVASAAAVVTICASLPAAEHSPILGKWNGGNHSQIVQNGTQSDVSQNDTQSDISQNDTQSDVPQNDTQSDITQDDFQQENIETFIPDNEKFETAQNKVLSDYDSYGMENSNVIPVEKNGKWGLLDYSGKVLAEPMYSDFWYYPNNKGYTTFKDGATYVILDNKGQEVVRYDDVSNAVMCENDVVKITNGCDVTYQHLNGEVIGSTKELLNQYLEEMRSQATREELDEGVFDKENWYVFKNSLYYGGRAQITLLSEIENWGLEIVITESGAEVVDSGSGLSYDIACSSNGYVVSAMREEFGYNFYNSVTNQHINWVDGTAYSVPELRAIWPESEWYALSSYGDLEIIATKNGQIANYYSYAVLNFKSVDYDENGNEIILDQKDVLFDFRKQTDSMNLSSNAFYDDIAFNDYKYLAVFDKERFFIDLDGNIVSDSYLDISSFTPLGYAMVMEEEGTAYIVNDQFEVVETIENVERFHTSNELFIITNLDGTIYSYYYNPNN